MVFFFSFLFISKCSLPLSNDVILFDYFTPTFRQFFILLNILLAILVDAYIAVRSSSTLSSDVISEIIDIFLYYTYYITTKKFISDSEIENEIELLLKINKEHMKFMRAQMVSIKNEQNNNRVFSKLVVFHYFCFY